MLIATLHSMLPDAAGAPEWVHLVPAGIFSGADGRGPFKLGDPASVIAASMAGNAKLPIDENHAIDRAMTSGQPSPARGYVVGMEARPDGIWGRVDWTNSGRALMEDRAYRGISPTFQRSPAGDVVRVLRVALTHTPNLPQLATLHSEGPTMDLTTLRAALGLPETATETAIIAAAVTSVETHSTQIAAIAAAAGAKATDSAGLVVELQAIRATTVDPSRVIELQTRIDALTAERARDKAVAFIDGAIKAGKPINPSRDQLIELHMANPTSIEGLVNAMPSINAGGIVPEAPGNGGVVLSAMDREVAERMGLDPAKYAEHLKVGRASHDAKQGEAA